MKSRLRRKNWWRPWALRLAVVVAAAWGFWTLQHSPYPKTALRGLLGALTSVGRSWSTMSGGVTDHFGAVAENQRLRRQIEQFTWELQSYEMLVAENRRLRRLLAAVPPPGYRRMTVPIIARSPDTWHSQVLIGAGRAEGVVADVAALTAEGLVGRVIQIGEHHATVQLMSDPLSAVSSVDVRSNTFGMVTGQQQGAAGFEYLRQNADVKKGDLISTSGLGVFPRGIPIGVVRHVQRVSSRINPEITVDLLVDFDDLHDVVLALPAIEAPKNAVAR